MCVGIDITEDLRQKYPAIIAFQFNRSQTRRVGFEWKEKNMYSEDTLLMVEFGISNFIIRN